jgi:hypothetical protein
VHMAQSCCVSPTHGNVSPHNAVLKAAVQSSIQGSTVWTPLIGSCLDAILQYVRRACKDWGK